MSISLQPRWRIEFKELKVEKTSFNWLFMLIIESLSCYYCLKVMLSNMRWWDWEFWTCLLLSSDFVKNEESGLNIFYFIFSFLFYFWFIFLYSIFRTRIRVKVIRPHCHTLVTSDDTVTVTSHIIHRRT